MDNSIIAVEFISTSVVTIPSNIYVNVGRCSCMDSRIIISDQMATAWACNYHRNDYIPQSTKCEGR